MIIVRRLKAPEPGQHPHRPSRRSGPGPYPVRVTDDGPRTFHIRTFGCQMNEHDSARIADLLRAAGGSDIVFDTTEYDLGARRYNTTGELLPDAVVEELRGYDAILLGAIGDPRVPDHVSAQQLLLPLRQRVTQPPVLTRACPRTCGSAVVSAASVGWPSRADRPPFLLTP